MSKTPEKRIAGKCACGRSVTKIENSAIPTMRTDGTRFVYPGEPERGSCIFRCDDCLAVIDETWRQR